MYHTVTWILWLASALVPAMLTKNPLYLIILLVAVGVDYKLLGGDSPSVSSWQLLLKAGLVLTGFSIIFAALTAHHGETVLLTLPSLVVRFHGVTFLRLGGDVTLEAVSYGLANGLNLMVVLVVFATFNTLVNHHQLLRSIPSFMYQTGVIASIAITFVPQMASSLKDIREAQAIRGHRFRGLRDLLPLFAPLLTSGLERSMQLAESMEARGFAEATRPGGETRRLVHKALIPLALFTLLAGVFLYGYFASRRWIGALLAIGALLLLSGNLSVMGRRVQRSHYNRELWRRRDILVSAAAVASMAVMAAIWLFDAGSLLFYPYPQFAFPTFNPLVGLALLAAVVPVLAAPQQRGADHDRVPRTNLHIS